MKKIFPVWHEKHYTILMGYGLQKEATLIICVGHGTFHYDMENQFIKTMGKVKKVYRFIII